MGNLCSFSITVDKPFHHCWDCVSDSATQIHKFEENLRNLMTKLGELQADRNDVRRKVVILERQGMLRLDKVEWWLSLVEAEETEVNELIRDCEANPKKNHKWWFKYRVGKKIVRKLSDLKALKSQGQFDAVAVESSYPPCVVARPNVVPVGFQSSFDAVWKHLTEEDDVGIVGIYGMGGVGKTTLMTQINNEFLKRPHDFETVIWALVSKDVRIGNILDEVGKRIGCYNEAWSGRTHEEKVSSIFRILSERKFVLLLDDVWEQIDLRRLGVPFPNMENKSKVIFTTRSEIVCGKMEAQRKIKVDCLAWKEAWELFQEKVGKDTLHCHPKILEVAPEVAIECGGLPLVLITIGQTMACKRTPEEWRYTIQVLKKSASEFSGMGNEVFPLLKFSYDNLPNDRIRSCFLYIALFPADFSIEKIDLIDYLIGEGILGGHDSTNEAHNCGHDIIGTLVHACLLEQGNNSDVKMHAVVREMALWIANDCGNAKDNIIAQTGIQLNSLPDVRKWMLAKRVSFMHNKITMLTEAPKCPNLSTLLLGKNMLKVISNGFFEFMPALTVLDLSRNRNLRDLPLTVATLVSLQYLNLSFTSVRRLPLQLAALVKLSHLNLNYSGLKNVPNGVISSLKMLQVAKMAFYGDTGNNSFMEKLECLEHLDCLHVSVTGNPSFQSLTSSVKLQNCTQYLLIYNFQDLMLNISSLANMKTLKELQIKYCKLEELRIDSTSERRVSRAREALPNGMLVGKTGFHNLTNVQIIVCQKLKEVTWLIFAPNLRFLTISRCTEMEYIISREKWEKFLRAEGNLNLFKELESLSLLMLDNLRSIHWEALPLPQLKQIRVDGCQQLKQLPLNSNSTNARKVVIEGDTHWWNNLKWEDDGTQNAFLHCFQMLPL